MDGSGAVSDLILAWGQGDEAALGRLISVLYPELRRIARLHLKRRQVRQSLESAALANEAYLKLVRAGGIRCEDRTHFLALCSQIIRRLLVDHARSRGYAKRGGGAAQTTLDGDLLGTPERQVEVLALDEALHDLANLDARKARVVELRYFGGLSVEETAAVLRVSPETAKRDWRLAKAWLFGALTSAPQQSRSGPART